MSVTADYRAAVATLPDSELAARVRDFTGVEHVIAWMQELGKPAHDFVKHDEFYYDFLVEFEAGRWVVFGVN